MYPLLILLLTIPTLFLSWGYLTDTDVQYAMNIILSSRRELIFDATDMDALKHSSAELRPFIGNEEEIYRCLMNACPNGRFISTGYTNEDGYLLFGGFSLRYDIRTGESWYSSFEGLYYITVAQQVCRILPEDCEAYAPAVLKLYQLDTFDTPLF